jgi:lysophospholipase L1-like esterase
LKKLWVTLVVVAASYGQPGLMPEEEAFKHYDRMIQLMESTTVAVPGLVRAGAPVIENARQALVTMRGGSPRDGSLHYSMLVNARAYLALADAMPKPFPFPQEALRQFAELRAATERAESHFEALLAFKEAQLREPDRDNLRRYAEANSRVGAPQAGKPRVVFLGDSITDAWRLNEYFPERDYINRGISGQITGQMLGRMQADVIALRPAAVVVLAGTNDIARGVSPETIQNNLTMIATLAEAAKIKVVLASILPVHDYNKDQNRAWERTSRRPPETIKALNQWIAGFCQRRGYRYLDYYSAMVDAQGMLQKELADDGLHPNGAGYRVMAPLVEQAITSLVGAAPEPVQKKERRRFPF